jgi:hypothetical protein
METITTIFVWALGLLAGIIIGCTINRPSRPKPEEKKPAPVKPAEEDEEEKEKINKFEKALGNLDRYNGTDEGQEDID